jgi:hypothetical protein
MPQHWNWLSRLVHLIVDERTYWAVEEEFHQRLETEQQERQRIIMARLKELFNQDWLN